MKSMWGEHVLVWVHAYAEWGQSRLSLVLSRGQAKRSSIVHRFPELKLKTFPVFKSRSTGNKRNLDFIVQGRETPQD